MRSCLVSLFCAALAFSCVPPQSTGEGPGTSEDDDDTPPAPGQRLVGYYTSWATYDRDVQVATLRGDLLTHLNYAFVNVAADGECILGDPYADIEKVFPGDNTEPGALHGNFNQLLQLKERFPHLKTLLSVGGYTWSESFSALAMTAEGRARFASSCADLMETYGFDGLDVDWEYPGGGGLAPGQPADRENFTLLLREVRAELDRRGDYLLTIAASASQSGLEHLEVEAISAELDWINIMAYDYHGSWETVTGLNAPLGAAAGDPNPLFNVTASVDAWIEAGAPPGKLNLGVPMYGRSWAGVAATNDGLFASATGAGPDSWEDGVVDWKDLAANYLPSMTRHWSDQAQTPWLYDPASGVMITYDDAESLRAKVALAQSRGLGGVMAWDLTSDDVAATLLTAVHDALAEP